MQRGLLVELGSDMLHAHHNKIHSHEHIKPDKLQCINTAAHPCIQGTSLAARLHAYEQSTKQLPTWLCAEQPHTASIEAGHGYVGQPSYLALVPDSSHTCTCCYHDVVHCICHGPLPACIVCHHMWLQWCAIATVQTF